MPATHLTQKPTHPDFKHHSHWGCIQASRSGSTFLHPDFCGTGAFGAGLITLDGHMPTFLYHVCLQAPKISSNNGAACSRAADTTAASAVPAPVTVYCQSLYQVQYHCGLQSNRAQQTGGQPRTRKVPCHMCTTFRGQPKSRKVSRHDRRTFRG